MSTDCRQRGFTLIELIVFIVIVSVALTGVLTVLNITTRHSADPMVRKQALAIAEALLEEVMLQPFTWCDPDDVNAATATSAAGCAGGTAAESRSVGSTTPFDNVSDYNGLSTTANVAGGGAALYTATVTVAAADLGTITAASGNSLLITVSVVAPGETIQVQGYRTRHSPNMLP
jgi:MSHA pilin protein MshD